MATHREVAHAWANKTGKQQKGPNVFYEDDTIFSYGRHFPIAKHIEINGKNYVLMTTKGYSTSTSKHISHVLSSISHLNVIRVSSVMAESKYEHKENYECMLKERVELLTKASRARTWKEIHLGHANAMARQANNYTRLFKLGYHLIAYVSDHEIQTIVDNYSDTQKAQRASQLRANKKALAERTRQAQIKLEQWQKGDNVICPHFPERGDFVRVKLKNRDTKYVGTVSDKWFNNDVIQTSKGSTVPLNDALLLFKVMQRCAKHKKAWFPTHEPVQRRIGDFKVDHISEEGTLVVACHTIPLANAIRALEIAGIEI